MSVYNKEDSEIYSSQLKKFPVDKIVKAINQCCDPEVLQDILETTRVYCLEEAVKEQEEAKNAYDVSVNAYNTWKSEMDDKYGYGKKAPWFAIPAYQQHMGNELLETMSNNKYKSVTAERKLKSLKEEVYV